MAVKTYNDPGASCSSYSKEVFKVQKDGACQRDTGSQNERAPRGQICNNLSNIINNK